MRSDWENDDGLGVDEEMASNGRRNWLIGLALSCAVIGSWGLNSLLDGYYVSTTVKDLILPTLVVWGIFTLLTSRSRATVGHWILVPLSLVGIFAAGVLCTMVANALLSLNGEEEHPSQFHSKLQKDVAATILRNRVGVKSYSFDTTTTATGDEGKVERVIRRYLNATIAERMRCNDTLEEIQWEGLLSAQRIALDPKLVQSRMIADSARSISQRTFAHLRKMNKQLREEVAHLDIDEVYRASILRQIDSLIGRTGTSDLIDLDEKIFEQTIAVLDLLDRTQGYWRVEGKTMFFDREKDRLRYVAARETLDSLTEAARTIREEAQARF